MSVDSHAYVEKNTEKGLRYRTGSRRVPNRGYRAPLRQSGFVSQFSLSHLCPTILGDLVVRLLRITQTP